MVVHRDDAFGSSMSQAVMDNFNGSIVEIPYDFELVNHKALDHGALSAQLAGAIQDVAGESEDSGVAVFLI